MNKKILNDPKISVSKKLNMMKKLEDCLLIEDFMNELQELVNYIEIYPTCYKN